MKLSDFLIPLIFMAVIVYRVYKKKKSTKETKEENATVDTKDKEQDSVFDTTSIYKVFVQPVDFDKLEESKKVAVSVETVITDYLADIDRMGALKPTNIKFFTNYNRIFIVYIWT